MHFNDIREAQRENQENTDDRGHIWEKDNMPVLHSGFVTGTTRDPKWTCLLISVWYANGFYTVRIQDRERQERAFVEMESLANFWETLELKFTTGRITWKDDVRPSENKLL